MSPPFEVVRIVPFDRTAEETVHTESRRNGDGTPVIALRGHGSSEAPITSRFAIRRLAIGASLDP